MQKLTSAEGFKWSEVVEEMGRNETDRVYGQTAEEDIVNHLRRHREAELADEEAYFKELQVNSSARPTSTRYDKEVEASQKSVVEKRQHAQIFVLSSPETRKMLMHMSALGQSFRSAPFFRLNILKKMLPEARMVSRLY